VKPTANYGPKQEAAFPPTDQEVSQLQRLVLQVCFALLCVAECSSYVCLSDAAGDVNWPISRPSELCTNFAAAPNADAATGNTCDFVHRLCPVRDSLSFFNVEHFKQPAGTDAYAMRSFTICQPVRKCAFDPLTFLMLLFVVDSLCQTCWQTSTA
jgi:hypothetical protein